MLDFCAEHGVTFFAHSPAGGAERVRLIRENPALQRLAEDLGASAVELVIAWVLARSPGLGTIPGASRPASIESSVRASAIDLPDDALASLDEAFGQL
jgi:aryl-alcohol dehydrogenase-like predicted oxidoreductase